jgi:NAD(P)-dependent dehydrogenase (short-subunit alcohol dehydrogenase family)
MKIALVTGANKDIGFETVKQTAQKGFYIYLGCRNSANGLSAVEKLKAEGLSSVEVMHSGAGGATHCQICADRTGRANRSIFE